MTTICQTLKERVADETKTPLDAAFIDSLIMTANNNDRTPEDLWVRWRTYVQTCEGYDQSPVFREFCDWNKLAGAGPLA